MKWSRYRTLKPFRTSTIDKILASGMRKQLIFLLLLAFAVWSSLYLSARFMGFDGNDIFTEEGSDLPSCGGSECDNEEGLPLWWTIYYHFVDAGGQHSSSEPARGLVMLISLLGTVVLSGIFISTFSNIIERRVEKYRKGLVRYRLSNHIILFGYNEMTSHLVRQLHNSPKHRDHTILIQTSRSVEEARQELESRLTSKECGDVIFAYGGRDIEKELCLLCVDRAMEVFILGEGYEQSQVEYAHDSLNMDCLNLIGKICNDNRNFRRRGRLECNISFEYHTTFSAFQFSQIDKKVEEAVLFKPFNIHEDWAQRVFVLGSTTSKNVTYEPLDREPITVESDKSVHLVVIGMSKMGIAMAMEAMRIAHFPNFRSKGKRTKITMIDTNADEELMYLRSRNRNLFDLINYSYEDLGQEDVEPVSYSPAEDYRHLHNGNSYIDLTLEFIKGNAADPKFYQKIKELAKDENSLLTIAVCFNLPHISLSNALAMPDEVYERKIPVLVLQRDSSAVVRNIAGLGLDEEGRKPLKYSNLRPFGMDKDSINIYANDNLMAKRVKYVYQFYYDNDLQPVAMPAIEELNELWYKGRDVSHIWADIYNADSIPTKLRSVGYTKDDWQSLIELTDQQVEILAEVEHNRWNVDRLMIGFRPPREDEDKIITDSNGVKKREYKNKYIHYDLRPYNDLRVDHTGRNVNEYDVCITRALPLIIK